MQRRRVVTGQTPDGTSVIAADEQVDGITLALNPGGAFHSIWGGERPSSSRPTVRDPALPDGFPRPAAFVSAS